MLITGGYDPTKAAAVISIANRVLIFSGTACGQIADRSGKRDQLLYGCMIVAIVTLLLPQSSLAVALSLLFGLIGVAPAGVEAVKAARGRIPVIAGAGSNSTREALFLTRAAEQAGADALLHVTGYYNKPSQQQVIEHFRAIDRITRLPVLVYNIPSRTGQELTVDTIAALAELEHVAGVKDSTGQVARVTLERQRISRPFSYLSGDDATCLGYAAHGGDGCISVTANLVPRQCAEMFIALRQGDLARARLVHDALMPLHAALFLEPSPAGVKYAMFRLGLCANELRMPLSAVGQSTRAAIDRALALAGVDGLRPDIP